MFKLLGRYLRWFDYLLMVLIVGLTVLQVWFMMQLTDQSEKLITVITLNDLDQIISEGCWMIGYACFYTLTNAVINAIACMVSVSWSKTLRKAINDSITNMSMEDMKRFQVASLITRATNDIQHIFFTFLITMRMIFAAPITAIWAFIKIGTVSWNLAYVPGVGLLCLIAVIVILLVLVVPKFKVQQACLDKVNAVTQANLSGIRVVHAFNGEEYQNQKFEEANDTLTRISLFTGRAMNVINPWINIVMNGIILGIYWLGATVINNGDMNYAELTKFMMLSTQIIMSFMMLLFMFIMIPRAIVCARRLNEVLACKSKIADPDFEEEFVEEGSLEFDDVTFQYPDADAPVIEHVSFKVEKGQTAAIIGMTGSGKSSTINLINRLYDVSEGAVKINGVDIRNIKQSTLRSLIGYVPQKAVLFSGTVASNICLGAPDLEEEGIVRAAEIACADNFINEMEGGYEARIAQGGSNVSGGQRQRLCIARAVACNPSFYLFDDSFSALDFKTDLKVRTNLHQSCKEATKVIVAQRVGTIMEADIIVVLHEGKMVGKGTHKELLQNCDEYRQIALSQLSAKELGL